jgi:phosphoribosyl 1,2-cyclic phosphodiesterase
MRITVWGCRGSISVPGPSTLRYGGNSTCLEIRTAAGDVIVVDAGSGIRNLGKALLRDPGVSAVRFFFTHSHLDHLVGFPFFAPGYASKFSLTFCGGPHAQSTIRKCLSHQMEAPYFPVDISAMKAQLVFRCERPRKEPCNCRVAGIEISQVPLNHPNGGYGFKFMEGGKAFVFLTDNELGYPHPGGLERAGYAEFCRNADLLFHDAQYTQEEYRTTRGWGHSSYADATDLAIEAGVRRLGLFHHDPDRSDDELDRQVGFCRERIARAGSAVACFATAEGMTLDL